jgi:predicted ATP-dependent endonuclease of OLD family
VRNVAFLLLFLCSCATVKKNEKRTDSTVTRTLDSVHVTFYDSVTKVIEKEQYFTKTITYYDTLWVTKDSMITIPKYTETYTRGTKEKQSDTKLSKKDSVNTNKSETIQKTTTEKSKEKTANNLYKILFFIMVIFLVIYIYEKLRK